MPQMKVGVMLAAPEVSSGTKERYQNANKNLMITALTTAIQTACLLDRENPLEW